jgi:imidazolonepropionase-like amidohydrolase
MRTRLLFAGCLLLARVASAQIAALGEMVYTMSGAPVRSGVVLIRDGKIERVGPSSQVQVPSGYRVMKAAIVTPGLIDAHTVAGLTGYLNQAHDQEQVERSKPMQPELRAIDAYDPRELLIGYVRGYGVTTIHTGHGPGVLVSGRTMIVKTVGDTVEEAVVNPDVMIAATLGVDAREPGPGKSPGTRAKAIAMLRAELIKAQEKVRKQANPPAEKAEPPSRDLELESWVEVLNRQKPLLVNVHRAHDILSAIRLGKEFNINLVLDGVSEAHQVLDQIRQSGYPVIVHPAMERATGDRANIGFETAAKLKAAGIPFAMQSGFEGYVPKTRVLLFEAGVAAAHGLGFENTLSAITIDAAKLLGIADRVGSLEPGKDGDVALYDGDPFEYTSHCVGVIVNGKVASEQPQ